MAKILVSMPDKFLESIDKLADNEQRTRSELIREALRSYIKRTNNVRGQNANVNANILENLLD